MKRVYFRDLPVGTRILYDDNREYIMISGSRYEFYSQGKLNHTSSITINSLDLFDEQIIIPPGYQTPLWKVLNGEETE